MQLMPSKPNEIQSRFYARLHRKPLDLIKGIDTDYDAAWEYLDSIYGDPCFVSDTITKDIVKFPHCKREKMLDFVI